MGCRHRKVLWVALAALTACYGLPGAGPSSTTSTSGDPCDELDPGSQGCPCVDGTWCEDGLVCNGLTCEPDPYLESTDDSSSSSGFIPDADAGPCQSVCDIWNPIDCPEGEKCTAASCEPGSSGWDIHVCRLVQGEGALGDECMSTDGSNVSGNDTCAAGYMCFDVDADTQLGTCYAFCEGTASAGSCPPDYHCSFTSAAILTFCWPHCDPLAQDCSQDGEMCIPLPDETGFHCVSDASGGVAPYGTPCIYANSCNPGLLCIDATLVPDPACDGAEGCCSPLCSLWESTTCPGEGQTCEPLYDPLPPGFEEVGICRLPSP